MFKNYIIKLLVVFLLLSQFVTLAHAIEHGFVSEDEEQCFICLHESDSKNTLIDTLASISFDFSTYKIAQYQFNNIYFIRFSLYNNRSPPFYP